MHLSSTFVPTASEVGLLPMVTYFFISVAAYSFLGNLIFSLATHSSVVPEHRTSRVFEAIIAAVAGVSYFLILTYYHHMLEDLAKLTSDEERRSLINHSYQAIGGYRYMDWAVTTPLLLLKMVGMLRIKPHEAKRSIRVLLCADFFMILTGFIGEQQLTPDGHIQAGPKLLWGAISTAGYVLIPLTLRRLWQQFKERAREPERHAFKWMALTTVTTWGVYPIGYLLTLTDLNLDWIHIAFTIADIVNKVGVVVVVYLAAKKLLEERLPEEAVLPGHQVS
ncbi:bacteriorhodopsin [Hymenobacter sp.]|jgi:bacteriorhodopsin|uniref:bacteriorhodopsin n=1 Tax=Hymenobacter sp. TaxID=1898978 RepID=UPI002EDAD07D